MNTAGSTSLGNGGPADAVVPSTPTTGKPAEGTPNLERWVRAAGFLLAAGWGWYNAASIRTSGWGYDLPLVESRAAFMAFCLLGLPVAIVPLIGLPWRRAVRVLCWLTLAVMAGAEGFGRGQEQLLVERFGRRPTQDHHEARWWPFDHHGLGCRDGQWYGND